MYRKASADLLICSSVDRYSIVVSFRFLQRKMDFGFLFRFRLRRMLIILILICIWIDSSFWHSALSSPPPVLASSLKLPCTLMSHWLMLMDLSHTPCMLHQSMPKLPTKTMTQIHNTHSLMMSKTVSPATRNPSMKHAMGTLYMAHTGISPFIIICLIRSRYSPISHPVS